MSIIKVSSLHKTYKVAKRTKNIIDFFFPKFKYIEAVNGISFDISKGESVAFIGPNGAGKSTTIKMLIGILTPSEGEILIMNKNPQKNRKEIVQNIGVVFGQKGQLWWDLPVIDSFNLIKHIYKIPEHIYQNNLNHFINLLNLNTIIDQPVRLLSLGQRMRAEIVAALLHNPKIILLDEPFMGLDIVAKFDIINFIQEINKKNKITILLTTHDLTDVEKLCQRIIIINKGRCMYDGSLNFLKEKHIEEKKIIKEEVVIPKIEEIIRNFY